MKKQRPLRLDVALGLCLWLMAFSVSAFYNPTSGRWLNRDPSGEPANANLLGYAGNDAINHADVDGRDIFKWPPIEIPWPKIPINWPPEVPIPPIRITCCWLRNPLTTCCCNGVPVAKRPIRTGIEFFLYQENPDGSGKVHAWVSWNGGSVDSNSDEMTKIGGGPGDHIVRFPAGWTRPEGDKGVSITDRVILSPCEYNFGKLNACLSREARKLDGTDGGECRTFAGRFKSTVEDCKKESKGCTAN